MTALLTAVGVWWIDYLLAATIVLASACAGMHWLAGWRAGRRIAWTSALGLLSLGLLTAWSERPKLIWRAPPPPLAAALAPLQSAPLDHFATTAGARIAAPIAPGAAMESVAADAAPIVAACIEPSRNWTAWCGLVCLLGMTFVAARTMIGWLGVRRLLHESLPLGEKVQIALTEQGGPRIDVRLSPKLAAPAAAGLFRPVILLPAAWTDAPGAVDLDAIVRHELAHLQGGDLAFRWLERGLEMVLFVHPLFWLWRRQTRLNQELHADAIAAGDDAPAYAHQLVQWAKRLPKLSARRRWAPVAVHAEDFLQRRIVMLLDRSWVEKGKLLSTRRRFALTAFIISAVALGSTLSFAPAPARIAAAEQKGAKETAAVAAPAAKNADGLVEIKGVAVDDAGKPIKDVTVELWSLRETVAARRHAVRLRSERTNAQGQFSLGRAEKPREPLQGEVKVVIARANGFDVQRKDLAPGLERHPGWDPGALEFKFIMPQTAVAGVVLGPNDQQLPGIRICGVARDPPELGAREYVTDERGRFRIPYSKPFQLNGASIMRAVSKEFGVLQFAVHKAPDEIVLRFPRPAVVTFRTLDSAKRPIAGVVASTKQLDLDRSDLAPAPEADAVSDAEGNVRLLFPGAGTFNIHLDYPGDKLVARAIVALTVTPDRAIALPDVVLTPGALLRGRLVDETTRQPLQVKDGQVARIVIYGPQNPLTSRRGGGAMVRADGTFEKRVAPGEQQISLQGGFFPLAAFDADGDRRMTVKLKEGETRDLSVPIEHRRGNTLD